MFFFFFFSHPSSVLHTLNQLLFGLPLETSTTQITILNIPGSTSEIKYMFHSGNPLQLFQQVSQYMGFGFAFLSKNLISVTKLMVSHDLLRLTVTNQLH